MGISRRTIEECTCDICGAECRPNDGVVSIKVNNGDGRDVGPAYINGNLSYNAPYGVSNGVVCKACKLKWLTQYVALLGGEYLCKKHRVAENIQELRSLLGGGENG